MPLSKKNLIDFYTLFGRFIGRDIFKNRTRTILTLIGIALGVSILLAINLANQAAISHFKDSLERVSGKANLTITSNSIGYFPETVFSELTWLWQSPFPVKMTPVIDQTALYPEQNNFPATVVQVLGVDMLADGAFRSYDWAIDSQPKENEPEHFLEIFNQDTAFIGGRFAKDHHLSVGDRFPLLMNDQRRQIRVAGILSDKGLGGAYGGDLVLMDIGPAQEAFGWTRTSAHPSGKLSRIDLIIPEQQLATTIARLEKTLPTGVEIQRPQRRSEQVEKMLHSYQYNLTVLSFIALLVGMFLIYNTMSITIIRRRSEIGTLRALGLSRRCIFLLFGTEALLFGISGSVLGVVLGILMAQGALQAVSTTVQNLYTGLGISGLAWNSVEVLKAFVFGVLITTLGGLVPVVEAASVSPAEASRRASYETRVKRVSKKLLWLGLASWTLAGWAAQQPPINNTPIYGFVSALFIVLGGALLMPFFVEISLQWLTPLLKKYFGQEGKLCARHLSGALGRTSVAIASLMIGIAMMVSLAVMIGSFRETVITWVNQTLKADLWIEPASRGSGQLVTRLTPKVIDSIQFNPNIEAVDLFFEFPIQFKNKLHQTEPARVAVGKFNVMADYAELEFLDGRATPKVVKRVLDNLVTAPSVLVTESFATRNQIRQGEMITLDTPGGPIYVRVEGIYYDYASDLGYIAMPRELYNLYYEDDSVTGLALFLKPGVSAHLARNQIYASLGEGYQLRIRTNQELRQEVLRIFDNTFQITYALHAIAIIVALLGVMNSLFAIVLESRRDFGILKYLGASTQQIKKIILLEAGILGLLGNFSGLLIGFLLSLLLIFVINKQSFGWTIQFSIPYAFLIESFILVLVTAIASGIIPARLAAKTQAPEVIRAE